VNPGETLKATRHAAKLTQLQLAVRAGVDPGTISRLERGVSQGTHSEAKGKIEEALQARIWTKEEK